MNGTENTSQDTANQLRHEIILNLQSLFREHFNDASVTAFDELYQRRFNKSIASVLLQLALPDDYSKLDSSSSEDQENHSSSLTATREEQPNIDQTEDQLLQKITASGVVPDDFRYSPNSLTFDNGETFLAFVSNIDQDSYRLYIHTEHYMKHMKPLTETLQMYYSNPVSEQWIVKDVRTGLACVGKYEGVYHRIYIKEMSTVSRTYVLAYIDLGLVKTVRVNDVQFKYLLNYFGSVESMVIACRLEGIEFRLHNEQMPTETYNELRSLCRNGPFHIEPYDYTGGVLNVKIYDDNRQCLNDFLVEKNLAVPCLPALNLDDQQRNTARSDNYSEQNSRPLSSKKPVQVVSNQVNGDDSASGAYDDYEKTSSSTSNNSQREPKNRNTGIADKSDSHTNRQRRTNRDDRTNQRKRQEGPNVDQIESLIITVDPDDEGKKRLVQRAFIGLRHNILGNRQPTVQSAPITAPQRSFKFTNWICSSEGKESLWSNEIYGKALLSYIGKICDQRMQMNQHFARLQRQTPKPDDLDILHELVARAKSEQNAQASLRKWEDNSRINRRVTDLKFIFEFNGDNSAQGHPFHVSPSGLTQIINRQNIRSYFDLGCGDGVITSAIGDYLGLPRERIFGGDVFEGQSDRITFVKIDENECTIDLPDNHVDLITAFVAFHHIAELQVTLKELARILRPGGYLILREHDCRSNRSDPEKYLHFIHAVMMIARVGEFANVPEPPESSWKEQKHQIIDYMKTIHYRSGEEWQEKLREVDFHLIATLSYGANGVKNPQHLFYAVYQFQKKPSVSEPSKEKTSVPSKSENEEEFYE